MVKQSHGHHGHDAQTDGYSHGQGHRSVWPSSSWLWLFENLGYGLGHTWA